MTISQWYRVLIEDQVTMVQENDNPREFIMSRSELISSSTDWSTSYRRARLKGLGSEIVTFLWKLLHQLLPTEERLARCSQAVTASCKICPQSVANWLLSILQQYDPAVTSSKLLRLEFECEDSVEWPLVWLSANTLNYMWNVRLKGKKVYLYDTRATLESKICLLRETRFKNEY